MSGGNITNNNADMTDNGDAVILHINTGVSNDPNVFQHDNVDKFD